MFKVCVFSGFTIRASPLEVVQCFYPLAQSKRGFQTPRSRLHNGYMETMFLLDDSRRMMVWTQLLYHVLRSSLVILAADGALVVIGTHKAMATHHKHPWYSLETNHTGTKLFFHGESPKQNALANGACVNARTRITRQLGRASTEIKIHGPHKHLQYSTLPRNVKSFLAPLGLFLPLR